MYTSSAGTFVMQHVIGQELKCKRKAHDIYIIYIIDISSGIHYIEF